MIFTLLIFLHNTWIMLDSYPQSYKMHLQFAISVFVGYAYNCQQPDLNQDQEGGENEFV